MATNPEKKGQSRAGAAIPDVELSTNPVLAEIKPPIQPYDQRHYAIVVGYIGEMTAEFVQVYPQLDLRTYLNIPRKAIVFAEQVVPNQKSSPTKLVVHSSAKVDVVKVYVRSVEAGFLTGPIATSNLGAARSDLPAGTNTTSETTASGDPCYATAAYSPEIPPTCPYPNATCAPPTPP
jgi:hypothetical protein